ncbi:CopG family ribbon-helix-helix protein [Nitrospirillum sp. BR 11752]|uniref:Putative transcriptional regulator n=1 Tax=Nitrospirillum amazonense TaxID=28077 RepID=A0A560HAI4_9PROT|nr:CopG family ribbon-helix-helix protein [Nitrospirillum amazonense]MEE3624661.1 CopG family ribbon-helix-helix protein [Nitrospirillum sp. BR 11752]TWB43356.1 putative transcriptional regulator [Nitrospirillum amazonense]
MSNSTTLTVRLKPEVKDQLALLSAQTNRTRSYLAAEAIAGYVEREIALVEGIQRGLADIEAGRLVPHDEAMNELDAAIEDVARGRV